MATNERGCVSREDSAVERATPHRTKSRYTAMDIDGETVVADSQGTADAFVVSDTAVTHEEAR